MVEGVNTTTYLSEADENGRHGAVNHSERSDRHTEAHEESQHCQDDYRREQQQHHTQFVRIIFKHTQ